MENNYSEKKEMILSALKDGNSKSTSEIASIIARDFYFTSRLLEEMLEEKLVEKTVLNKFTYWKLSNG